MRQSLAAISLILLAAFALRVLGIESQPLSGDEAYSVIIWAGSSAAYLIETIAVAVTEPHPPLALLSMRGWGQLAGDSILAMRVFAVLPNMMVMAAAYALVKRLADRPTALLAAGLLALNPFQVNYAQFARNYSLWMGLSALTLLTLYVTWQRPDSRRFVVWLPYIGLAALTGYVFYLEAFMFVAHNIYALFQVVKDRRSLPAWIGAQVTLALILAPWWLRPELFSNAEDYQPNGGPAAPLDALRAFVVGRSLPIETVITAVTVSLLAVALLLLWRHYRSDTALFITATALTPVIGLAALTLLTGRTYFAPRYIASSALPVVILMAVGWSKLTARGLPYALIAALCVFGLWGYHTNPTFRRGVDYPALFELLNDQSDAADTIIGNTPDPAFDYYYQHAYTGGAETITLPIHTPDGSLLGAVDAAATATTLEALSTDSQSLWFLPLSDNPFDRDQIVFEWLQDEQLYISDQWIGGIRLYQYADYTAEMAAIDHLREDTFIDVAHLRGYNLTPSEWEPGTTGYVELFWEPIAQTDEIAIVTLQLWDGNQVWAQHDQMPQGGRASMEVWQPGGLIRDTYALAIPPDLPPNTYTLLLSIYSADDPANRYRLTTGADVVFLTEFRLP